MIPKIKYVNKYQEKSHLGQATKNGTFFISLVSPIFIP